ncbi:hypothetical protein [Paraflavitalea speifideaquila]|uniref:hypothetical protein n=1 Tax=Paraflavitalea speifideaquila TaxID=3076558 RepID=UPI0028E9825F|nr:hypothetical protein [Paraflavitalea speifideiaquila]
MGLTFRLLFIYSITAFIIDRFSGFIETNPLATRMLSFAFTIFEYTIFTLFFYQFFHRRSFKRWVVAGSLIFITTVVLELDRFGVVYYSRFNAGTAVILIICYSLLLFYEWLMDDPMEFIYKKPHSG